MNKNTFKSRTLRITFKNRIHNRIHNLALDLKSGVITWEEFDKKLDAIIEDPSLKN